MNDKNNNSDSEDNPFGESLGLFDELPLPEKTAETPDSKKETPASGSPPGKKVQQKPPVKNRLIKWLLHQHRKKANLPLKSL